ncbi:FHA domain-containing protein [Streptomyces sp. N2-109]|uniref:FHA domain-containing protein n=1 Tax=Streptomyces gossypii TaxID=2883101 RepID=A0ABT2JTW9_9ACTN|nr:FHA domain-containing protein [Streptomyces gossypii]MCT2591305.1 FHA domain-containing protein [Streptomyces gossypii]
MQIRLTVLASRSGQAAARPCDVLVTAPPGTALAAVTDSLVTTAAAAAATHGSAADASHEAVSVYAGAERLDPHRRLLGEPPLIDGAVLSLYGPAAPVPVSAYGSAKARLHVVSGPDSGGVHLLGGGRVQLGRSAEADVALDDPDVSRLHCTVTVTDSGAVTVTDLGSTNGTTVDGSVIGGSPALLAPGARLRLGESVIRVEGSAPAGLLPVVPTAPDGEGHLRLPGPAVGSAGGLVPQALHPPAARPPAARPPGGRLTSSAPTAGGGTAGGGAGAPASDAVGEMPGGGGRGGAGGAQITGGGVPGSSRRDTAVRSSDRPHPAPASPWPGEEGRTGSGAGEPQPPTHAYATGGPFPGSEETRSAGLVLPPGARPPADSGPSDEESRRRRRGRGIGAWARRFTTARDGLAEPDPDDGYDGYDGYDQPGGYDGRGGDEGHGGGSRAASGTPAGVPADGEWDARWPDPATVLLTTLGPGPRLWERGPGHPEALTVRLGSTHHSDASGELPVTVNLRDADGLGLAGPRSRLSGVARSLLAQLAALHAPSDLEIVLISADHARDVASRVEEWAWLGWLPHLRPARGQDCRLLVAYDREQAAARTAELVRRLDKAVPPPPPADHGAAGHPSSPGDGDAAGHTGVGSAVAAEPHNGPYTVLVVDGDPGSAALRESVARLTGDGAAAGIHVLTLAETPPATPASPLDATVEAACAASPPFRECRTLALLSGSVATAVQIVRRDAPAPLGGWGPGTALASIDGVSAAWAQRFARALAPLREADGRGRGGVHGHPAASVALPQSCRLLDELGLARATPVAVLARWTGSARGEAPRTDSRAPFVLGAGPQGPIGADLAADRGHALITGPPGSGRTELLRALAASLAAGERPDRLGLVLIDGSGEARDGGLAACAELPHAGSHLTAGDPVRMREFAQSLSRELKRRAELIGERSTYDEYDAYRGEPGEDGTAPSGALPRLVVLVDDFDTLVDPALGNPGRPAAGSVVRALESVAREGVRLGVHLVTASARPERTGRTAVDQGAVIRIELTGQGEDEPVPGRGIVRLPGGTVTAFQAGRVTSRIPRTATLRPTVVPLDWARSGDPPTRRPVRELGNGPTDLALLASAMDRAAKSLGVADFRTAEGLQAPSAEPASDRSRTAG